MKKLTRIMILVVATVMAIGCYSCKNSASKADQKIAEIVAQYSAENDAETKTCTYTNKTLCFRQEVTKNEITKVNPDMLREKTLSSLQTPANQKLVTCLTEAGANLQYVYVNGNDSIVFTFTPAELKPKAE